MHRGRRVLKLPEHACGLYLEHNVYKDVYESITEAVAEIPDDIWTSLEERQRALDTGELWTLHWYPNTPIGFRRLAAASLETLLERFQ